MTQVCVESLSAMPTSLLLVGGCPSRMTHRHFYRLQQYTVSQRDGSHSVASTSGRHMSTTGYKTNLAATTTKSNHEVPLPQYIRMLMNPSVKESLPKHGKLSSEHNLSLDKVVLTLGRHRATWRRAILLYDWLVDNGHEFDERLCASVIRICTNRGEISKALDIYEWMTQSKSSGGGGICCSVYTYTSVMKAALLKGDFDYALAVWNQANSSIPDEMDNHINTVLIEALDRKGDVDKALETFSNVQSSLDCSPSVHTYTVAIKAATNGKRYDDAFAIWKELKTSGTKPSAHAYASIIHAYGEYGDWKESIRKFDEMVNNRVVPDVVSCTALVDALARNGCWLRAEKFIDWMKKKDIHPNVRTYSVLISAYASHGELEKASQLFDAMHSGVLGRKNRPNQYTYSLLIKQLAVKGMWKEAEAIFMFLQKDIMESKRMDVAKKNMKCVEVNDVICGSMMYAYERAGRWEKALEFFSICQSLGYENNTIITNIALSALAKAGEMKTAEQVFKDLSLPDNVTYETMVAGYGLSGNVKKAESLLLDMIELGYKPKDYAYCGLIAGYTVRGNFQKAIEVYDRAINAGVEPSVHLYNALLAACDRFHKYDRAILLLDEMKRCKIHGNAMTHNLTVSICTEGVRTVESQQAAITAISAAVAAAGSIMIRAGVF